MFRYNCTIFWENKITFFKKAVGEHNGILRKVRQFLNGILFCLEMVHLYRNMLEMLF
jgi:hypothetical protein